MALVFADLVQETTSTTGVGTLTCTGAVAGFQTFAAIGNANTTYYKIKSGNDSEVGIGTYTSSGTTLSRDTVLYSTAGGTTKITVAAGATVICTYPAEKVVIRDAAGNAQGLGNIPVTNLNSGTAASSSTFWRGDATWATPAGGGGSTITISNKTAAYTVIAGDNGTVLNWTSGTFTATLTAAATLGTGFNVWIWNTGTGIVTIDTNGTETIDGSDPALNFNMEQGSGIRLVCNGTGWYSTDVRMSGSSAVGVKAIQLGRDPYGFSPRASAAGGVALGGGRARGAGSLVYGYNADSPGGSAIVLSSGANQGTATATQGQCIAIGANVTAGALYSVAIGNGCFTNTNGATVISGMGFGSSTVSEGHLKFLPLYAITTNATPIQMGTEYGLAPSRMPQIYNNSAVYFKANVVSRQQASQGTASAAWTIEGLIRRQGSAATTTMVTSTVTTISNVPAWTVTCSADTTNGGINITFTGAAATNIRTLVQLQMTELSNYA